MPRRSKTPPPFPRLADEAPTPPAAPHPLRDQVTLLLLNGTTPETAEAFCVARGSDPGHAKQAVAEARKRITVAADFSRDEQVGISVARLNDIYGKSMVGADYKTALAANRDLSRLMGLYATPSKLAPGGSDLDADTARRQVEVIAGHLLPLKLAGDAYPLEEHARLAADVIRTNHLAKPRKA